MKITPTLTALLVATSFPLIAQTTAPKPAVHSTTVHHSVPGCAKLPEISPKIPALPAGTPCAKPLYTITRTSETRLDYASPLLSPELKASLAGGPSTYSLDYIDTKIGTGELAKPGKFYTVHYTGYLLKDGTKFDSSVDRGDPITFPYGTHRVIPGWDSGFEGMRVGGKRRLFIPYQLAYGEAGQRTIPPKSELVFDIEFIAQSDTQPAPKPRPVPTPAKPPTPAPEKAAPAPQPTQAPPPPPAASPAKPDSPARPDTVGGVIHPAATTAAPAPASTTPPPQPQQ